MLQKKLRDFMTKNGVYQSFIRGVDKRTERIIMPMMKI